MTGAHCYDWPRPAVTTDIAVFAARDGVSSILLIRRKGPPFAGSWALPGGFLDEDETLEACAARELREETGLVAGPMALVGAYSDPGRDPRGRTVTMAYWTAVPPEGAAATAGDDASQVGWFAIDALPALAFDHDRIIADAVQSMAAARRVS